MSYLVPTVVENRPRGASVPSTSTAAAERAHHLLGTPIDDGVANLIMAQLLHLEARTPTRTSTLYINSPGGSTTYAL